MIRIIQITDTHIGNEGELVRGVDVRANFLKTLRAIGKEEMDCLIHSGDLCAIEGKQETYQWIKEQISNVLGGAPFYVIPGNHDDPTMMAQIFGLQEALTGTEMYYKVDQPLKFIFLDTSQGLTSEIQKQWFNLQINEHPDNCPIIFMHHPPIPCGVPYLDQNYALSNGDELMNILYRIKNKSFTIFCGHYHVEKTISDHNVNVFITPSTFFQMDQDASEFKVDHYRCGYRIIEMDSNGKLYTTVRYLDF